MVVQEVEEVVTFGGHALTPERIAAMFRPQSVVTWPESSETFSEEVSTATNADAGMLFSP